MLFICHIPNFFFCFQKSTFYTGIKIFDSLPRSLTILKNEKTKFRVSLQKYLNTCSFYSVEEYFICKYDLLYCFVKLL